ncbi:uncharacterized protein K452DRAFT_295827 [Aplosporella prunicola CBS 121167]|uniref:Uncharacterized protein n=1 Tax=Aplosporella prunicola CBS 121167 TaxID=1176127 RepID=A0A6A6BJP1_9PEZI|nr:uncharacterized protein K452DRAFT_295827 [Aplosporella prunicola CBS 121167]KAF2144370.1 hypothetical protein K452DRAFT_295827 [Aplosporella prunicola CBS 121167]
MNATETSVAPYSAVASWLYQKLALVHAKTVSTFKSTTSPALTEKSKEHQEWVPSTLKKSIALPFAAFCFLLVGALEALRVAVTKNQGISASEKETVFFLKYLPTFCVVLLGLVWKSVTSEVKKLTPWSAMSGKWATAEESVLVNYIDRLEIFAVFSSAKRKHWAVFMAIVMGFMIGAAVTAANALAYKDLSATTHFDTPMKRLSRFDFDGTLFRRDPNTTITDYMGRARNRPYAAVAAERLVGGQSADFTSQAYAFDRFASVTEPPTNSTTQANVAAFNVDWGCQQLNYTINYHQRDPSKELQSDYDFWDTYSYWDLNAHKADTKCPQGITQRVTDSSEGAKDIRQYAWLNVTSCTGLRDLRLLATFFQINPNNETQAVGVMCTPQFTIGQALVRIDQSGKVQSYKADQSTFEKIDIGTPMEAIYLYLVGINDAYDGADTGERSFTEVAWNKSIDLTFVHLAAYGFVFGNSFDTFFQSMTESGMPKLNQTYLEDPDLFEMETKTLARQIMTQVVSVFARVNEDTPKSMNGTITLKEPRWLLRYTALRILQAILAMLGIVMVLLSTLLRPKSLLKQDPGLLADTAIVLARSGLVEEILSPHAVTSDKEMQKSLASTRWRLHEESRGSTSGPILEVDTTPLPAEGLSPARCPTVHSGCHPIALRTDVKWVVAVAFGVVIAVLGLLQGLSTIRKGICMDGTTASNLFNYVPTLVLVLLSSSCSALDGATRAMMSYRSLRKPSKKQPLLSNFQDTSTFHALFRSHTKSGRVGFALAAASFATLVFPWIKIVAAGLYGTTTLTISDPAILHMDNSIIEGSETYFLSSQNDLTTATSKASKFTEWSVTPDFGIGQRPGVLDNLVISNLTEWSSKRAATDMAAYEIEAMVKAIAVNSHCEAVHSDEFEVLAHWSTDCGNRTLFDFRCKTDHCTKTLNIIEKHRNEPINFMAFSQPECVLGSYMGISWWDLYDVTRSVFLADFSSVTGPFQNYTAINANQSTVVDSSMFNVSLPTLRAVSCLYNVSAVDVNVTFTRNTNLDVGGATVTLPWAPSSYDRESLVYRSYMDELSSGALDASGNGDSVSYYPKLTTDKVMAGRLNSTSLWPNSTDTTNVYETVAAYAQYQVGNLSALLDAEQLAEAVSTIQRILGTETLTNARPLILEAANASSAKTITGTARHRQTRINQDVTTTIVLEVLLSVVLACLLWIIYRFPSSSMLPKEPNSIAARLSHFAGSALVRRVRDEGVSRVEETSIWNEKAGLGWWPVSGSEEDSASNQSQEHRQWRWGIDVGPDMVQQDWDCPPFGEGAVSGDRDSGDETEGDADSSSPGPEQATTAAPSPVSPAYERVSAAEGEDVLQRGEEGDGGRV